MSNYFRITVYHQAEDYSFIVDSNGRFEKLWQFSAYLIGKGLKVIEVSNDETFLDGNIPRGEPNSEKLYVQACTKGKPPIIDRSIDGQAYRAIEIGGRYYVPSRRE